MRPMYKNRYLTLGMKRRRVIHTELFYIHIYFFLFFLLLVMVLFCSFYTLISFYHLILVQLNVEFILFMEAVVIIMCVMINVKWEKPRAEIIHIWVTKKKPKLSFRWNLGNIWKLVYYFHHQLNRVDFTMKM